MFPDSLEVMTRPIFLLVYPTINQRTAAHWAIFIPYLNEVTIGKVIHAVGTPFTGFGVEFKRNYDYATTGRRVEAMPLGEVSDDDVVDVRGDGALSIDITVHDRLEREARRVDAPVASRTPLDPSVSYARFLWRFEADQSRLRTARLGFGSTLPGSSNGSY